MALFAHAFWYLVGVFGLSVGAHAASRGHPTTLLSMIVTGIPAALSGLERFTGVLSKISKWLRGGAPKEPLPPPPPWIFPPPGTCPPGAVFNAHWPYPSDARYMVTQQHQLQFVDAYGNVAWMPVGPRELSRQTS